MLLDIYIYYVLFILDGAQKGPSVVLSIPPSFPSISFCSFYGRNFMAGFSRVQSRFNAQDDGRLDYARS